MLNLTNKWLIPNILQKYDINEKYYILKELIYKL